MERLVVLCALFVSVVVSVPIQQNLQRHNIHEREFSFYRQLKSAKQKSPKSDFKKIVGGTDASAGEYPFQVSIGRQEFQDIVYFCGGAIVDTRHVVTAANCVSSESSAENLHITAGVTTLSEESEFKQVVKGEAITVHPNFVVSEYNYDIAIIKLASELTFNTNVDRILLPLDDEPHINSCVTLGWGLTSEDGEHSDTLQVIDIEIVSDEECEDFYGRGLIDHDTQICAGSPSGTQDFCQGDEGGAMACNGILYGLSSFGFGCARGYPSVFTQIHYFKDWIQANTH